MMVRIPVSAGFLLMVVSVVLIIVTVRHFLSAHPWWVQVGMGIGAAVMMVAWFVHGHLSR